MFTYPTGPLDGLLASAAEAHPERTAVVTGDRELTYAELNLRASAFAAALRDGLAEPGDVVALASPLHPDFVAAFHGVLRAGAVIAPINPFMRDGDLLHLLASSRAKVAVLTPPLGMMLASIRDRLPELRTAIILGSGGTGDEPRVAELVERYRDAAPAPRPETGPDDVACIQFTSGTTGAPKAAMLTHANLLANAAHVAHAHQLDGDSVVLNFLPKYHLLHMNSALRAGATQVLHRSDSITESVALANRVQASHYYTIPMRLARLAVEPELASLAFTSVRMIASGGSALPSGVADTLAAHFEVPVFQGYGLAETSSLTHSDGPERPKLGSVGPVVPDTECRIVDLETGKVLGADERGEVQVRGPQVMKGYVQEPEGGSGIDADGWLSTGDIGQVDEDGYLFLVDRIKDVFKCDNFLVSPSEIEAVLAELPGVKDCLVVDVPDSFSGAVPAVFLVVDAAHANEAAALDLVGKVNADHPYYKHLRHVEVVAMVPRAPMGKPDRKTARAEMARRFQPGTDYPSVAVQGGGSSVITLINKFQVKGDTVEFERVWKETSEFMRAQPGFLGYRFNKSLSDPTVYVNIALWADADAHRQVVTSEAFLEHVTKLGALATPTPELYTPVFEGEPIS